MNTNQQRQSKAPSIHHVLVKRLTLATLAIALAVAVMVSLVERNRIVDTVVDRALQRTAVFNAQYQALLDNPGGPIRAGLQQALAQLASNRLKERMGYFVYAELYDSTQTPIGEYTDRDFSRIDAITARLKNGQRPMPAPGDHFHEGFWLDNRPYIHVATPLTSSAGDAVAFLRGVYAVSRAAGTELNQRILRAIATVVGIVLITAALLYPVILNLMRKLTVFSDYLLESNLEILQVLGSAIAKRDSDTSDHNFRVTIIAVRLAEAAGLDTRQIKSLIKGAFLHDVGKIAITDNILHKPGRLDASEFTVMKTHVDHGLDIVERSKWLKDAVAVVGNHHEKCDGSGYPGGLDRQDIPITARIFAIADVFDALASKRPYKEPFTFEASMRILEESRGSHFDPELLDLFTTIARDLYDHLSGRGDADLRAELEGITRQYFSAGSDALSV
ncbi:MAG: HD domain-containing phosphohydrolase [Gammaproteobacteria bacterium]